MKLFAQTLKGLEPVLAGELEALGALQIRPQDGGVEFEGDKRMLYRANLELRTALKILYPIATFRAQTEQHLYDGIRHIDWSRYLDAEGSIAVDADCISAFFPKNSTAALRCRDAIGDQFEERYGIKPGIDTKQPSVRIHLSVREDFCQVSLDSSGVPLNNRGYEHQALDHSLNEVLAAGMIMLSGWQGETDFIDPMCGSGTLLIEAAMIAWKIPPLTNREYFGFRKWSNYDKVLWDKVKDEAKSCIRTEISCDIAGFDSAFQALRISERNIQLANLDGKIKVERLPIEKQKARTRPAMLMMCPPVVEDMSEEDAKNLYRQIGEMLKKKFKGSKVGMLIYNEEMVKHTGLKVSALLNLNNGVENCKFVQFDIV